MHVVISAIFYG